jgi:hypothetical protein
MSSHGFRAYPEDRYEERPFIKSDKRIWVMVVTSQYQFVSSETEIIRRPVKKIVKRGWFRKPKEITVWERVPDDPRIPQEQVEEWARNAVEYINRNLDADFPKPIKLLGVRRGTPSITFERMDIPEY